MKKELLAPAGDMACLKAAVFNGADAVYLASKNFGARKFASNFTNEELVSAIKFCHLYGVKIYITMNTLVKNNEVNEFIEQVRFLHKSGVDAIIVQDFGMICLIRKIFPNLEIHASTQANTSSYDTAEFYHKLGVKRVVFSRELSIDEIDSIDVPIEKEAFIHGALCISYSGECLMSSMLGGRSGNRGECAGCCRLPYDLFDNDKKINKDKYLLSTKEFNTTKYIDRLMNSSIYSFKIEGRMKNPLYVGFVTRLYRRLMDNEEVNLKEETKKLKTIFNREFTRGRLFFENDNNIMNRKSPNHVGLKIGNSKRSKDKIMIILDKNEILRQNDAIRFKNSNKGMIINFLYDKDLKLCSSAEGICYVDNKLNITSDDEIYKTQDSGLEKEYQNISPCKVPVNIKVEAKCGKNLKVEITDGINTIVEYGIPVEKAKNAPIDENTIIKHLTKFGNSPFLPDDIKVIADKEIFIQIKQLNDIRRLLVDKLIKERENIKCKYVEENFFAEKDASICSEPSKITCSVYNEEQLKVCLKLGIPRIYVFEKKLYEKYKKHSSIYYCVPRCSLDIKNSLTEKNIVSDYFNFNNFKCKIYGNYSLNVTNIYTAYFLRKYGLLNVPLSVELNDNEISEFIELYNEKFGLANFEVLSYGRVENMIIKGNILNISTDMIRYSLKDGRNRKFPLFYDERITHIFNWEKLNRKYNNLCMRLDFYDEDANTIIKIVKSYQ